MAIGFMERLRNTDDILVIFFAMQTLLVEKYGKPMETHLSEWILAHPEEFQDSLRQIYATGNDIVHIGTQASSPFRAKSYGIDDRIYELNYKSAKMAKEITPEGRYVAGLISSSNPDWLEPVGNMTYDEVYKGYLEQIKGLLKGGVDLIIATGNHIDETVIAVKAIKDHSDIPVMAGTVFYAGKKGFRTMTGLAPKVAIAKLQETGAEVLGFQCGLMTKSSNTSEWYPGATALLKEVKQETDKYLFIAPDAGLPQLINDKTVWPASPEDMAKEVLNWVASGVRIVGGCCGTSLEHNRKTSIVLRERRTKGT
ncbi:homocysteine S-methyltransferase family protein [Chloroflexota bacterium]